MNIIFQFMLLGAFAVALVIGFRVLKARRPQNTDYKFAVGLAFVAAFLLFWVNGAVGIIGASSNDANVMYFAVLAIGFIGALIARFQPHGMARAMFATAFAQAMIAVIALSAGLGATDPSWPWDILILTGFYSALWVGSAVLFQKAAVQEQLPAGEGPEG